MKSFIKILTIFTYIGSFPIEIKHKTYSPIKWQNIKYLTPTCTLLLVFGWCLYKKLFSHGTIDIQEVAILTAKILVTLRLMTVVFATRGKLAMFLNGLQKIEDEFINLNVSLSYRLMDYYAIFHIISIIAFSLTAGYLTLMGPQSKINESLDEWLTSLVSLNFNYVIIAVMMVQMAVFTYWIYERVRVINATLSRMSVSDRNIEISYPFLDYSLDYSNGVVSRESIRVLSVLGEIHYDLVELANSLDDIFGDGVFFLLVLIVIDTLLVCHQIYKEDIVLHGFIRSWFEITRVLSMAFEITNIVIPCSSLKRVVKRTSEILNIMPKTEINHWLLNNSSVLNDDDDDTLGNKFSFERELFLLQNHHHKVVFTVKGFFLLDETVYLTILAAVSSYFIIVIQFEETYRRQQ